MITLRAVELGFSGLLIITGLREAAMANPKSWRHFAIAIAILFLI